MRPRIKVLVVDDSAVVRQTMTEILSSDSRIEVIGAAADPFIAADRLRDNVPDVITLDIEMPRMDGITFLQKLMSQHPIPVVICSGLAGKGTETALKALEYGAVEIIEKPRLGTKQFLEDSKVRICQAVKAAAEARIRRLPARPAIQVVPKLTADGTVLLKRLSQAVAGERPGSRAGRSPP